MMRWKSMTHQPPSSISGVLLKDSDILRSNWAAAPNFIRNILDEKVDIVFNIAEGRGTYRSREAQVPSILEMLDIPYVGSDPECLAVCLDKPLTKKLLKLAGIPTPEWRMIANRQELKETHWEGFPFPAIVKPAYEGSSKGIHPNSLVDSPKQAERDS